jgi:predicted TPR repeat methyltransferase
MCVKQGYCGPAAAVEQFTRKLEEFGYSNDVRILDMGCGTGLVGEELHKRGYKNVDGIDLTPEMLELAKAKGVYNSLNQGAMGSPGCKGLGVSANQYDAAISVGVFSVAHAKCEGFDDLVHVVKPDGLVTFSIREFSLNSPQSRYHEKMEELVEEGKWKFLAKHREPRYLADDGALVFVYQIL